MGYYGKEGGSDARAGRSSRGSAHPPKQPQKQCTADSNEAADKGYAENPARLGVLFLGSLVSIAHGVLPSLLLDETDRCVPWEFLHGYLP